MSTTVASHPCFAPLTKALSCYRRKLFAEALSHAAEAHRLSMIVPGAPPRAALAASWYGFFLGVIDGKLPEGLRLCREAAEKLPDEGIVFRHLARLEYDGGSRVDVIKAIRRGLKAAPDDPVLLEAQEWIGMRRKNPVPFLSRTHPVNIWLGKRFRREAEQPPAWLERAGEC